MQSDFLFKRNEAIARFLSGLRALAMKDTTLDRLQKDVDAFVSKFLPSADLSQGSRRACLDYATSFRDFICNENIIRLFSDF